MANILGRQTLNGVHLLEVDSNPAVSGGAEAPQGSIATIAGGSDLFIKIGVTNTDWNRIPLNVLEAQVFS